MRTPALIQTTRIFKRYLYRIVHVYSVVLPYLNRSPYRLITLHDRWNTCHARRLWQSGRAGRLLCVLTEFSFIL